MRKSMGVVDVRRVRMLVTPISICVVWVQTVEDKNTSVFTLKTLKPSTRTTRVLSIFLDDSFKI